MSTVSLIFIFIFLGIVIGARQPDIDINRIKLLRNEGSHTKYPLKSPHNRRSILNYKFTRSNDYDDNSGGFAELRAPLHFLHNTPSFTETKAVKVHQPREDPRLFYQSDAYLKETNRKNMNNEVSWIYPGVEVVRAGEENHASLPIRLKERNLNTDNEEFNICMRCPHDRTLITKTGSDRAMLQYPRLSTCSGHKAPKDAHFEHMYGPKFGSLLGKGSHTVVGRITYKSKTLQLCKMQVQVVVQSCPLPKYLVSHCDDESKTCIFTCRDPKAELDGQSTLTCGDDMSWIGQLPFCKARSWCEPHPPPEHGRVSCKGATTEDGSGLAEGSSCRVKCARGWRWMPRAVAVCRRGVWTHSLACHPKRHH